MDSWVLIHGGQEKPLRFRLSAQGGQSEAGYLRGGWADTLDGPSGAATIAPMLWLTGGNILTTPRGSVKAVCQRF